MGFALVKAGHRRLFDNTEDICRRGIRVEFQWVPGHGRTAANEAADQFAKDAADRAIEAELPSEKDRCKSRNHLYGGVLQMRNGSVQVNGFLLSIAATNTTVVIVFIYSISFNFVRLP
jgi:hypothetical protein